MKTAKENFYAWLIPVVMLALAPLELPYGYYTFLRVVIFIFGIGILIGTAGIKVQPLWTACIVLMVILYNPIFTVHLTREIWLPINITSSFIFFVHWVIILRLKDTENR